MDVKGKNRSDEKNLKIILTTLGLIIFGLLIGIFIINMQKNSQTETSETQNDNNKITEFTEIDENGDEVIVLEYTEKDENGYETKTRIESYPSDDNPDSTSSSTYNSGDDNDNLNEYPEGY